MGREKKEAETGMMNRKRRWKSVQQVKWILIGMNEIKSGKNDNYFFRDDLLSGCEGTVEQLVLPQIGVATGT